MARSSVGRRSVGQDKRRKEKAPGQVVEPQREVRDRAKAPNVNVGDSILHNGRWFTVRAITPGRVLVLQGPNGSLAIPGHAVQVQPVRPGQSVSQVGGRPVREHPG